MKQSLDKITGFSIEAIDGPKGKVKDFLFDENTWVIKYMEADFGNILKNRKVLIPANYFKEPILDRKQFPVELTQEKIEECPDLDTRVPVSGDYEKKLSRHYGYDWPWAYTVPVGTIYFPSRPLNVPSSINDDEEKPDTTLQSFKESKGYNINAFDGTLGHLDDIIADDLDWQIVYVVVDTSNWIPMSKKVILPVNWLKEISYVTRKVSVNLHSDTIKNAPEFDPGIPLDEVYERELSEYYSRSMVNVKY